MFIFVANNLDMKKILALLVLSIVFYSCDNGNIDVVSFDFSTPTVKSCNSGNATSFYVYSFKENRAFILQIPESSFPNEVTADGVPRELTINATNKVTYREYSGTVSINTLCSVLPPTAPTVTKDWSAIGGTISMVTTKVVTPNATDGSTRITSYNHTITLKNIVFNTGNGEQRNDSIEIGTFTTTPIVPINFSLLDIKNCTANASTYFKTSGNQALSVTLDSTVFTAPTLGVRIFPIDGTATQFSYKVYADILPDNFFCTSPVPTLPSVEELWIADNSTNVNGVTSGIIEVTTETNGGSTFKHTIRLLNVTVTKGPVSFNWGTSYLFGVFPPN